MIWISSKEITEISNILVMRLMLLIKNKRKDKEDGKEKSSWFLIW